MRRQCYPLARVQPALKDSVREGADVTALAGALYRRKASALTIMQMAQSTHSALPALIFAQDDKFLLNKCQ